jgi:hypothetical protein
MLKRLLLVCLILCIPLQGFASVSRLLCPMQQHQPSAISTHHSMDHSQAEHASVKADKNQTDNRCSTCAFCCLGVAISAPTVAVDLPLISDPLPSVGHTLLLTHYASLLERPPKQTL